MARLVSVCFLLLLLSAHLYALDASAGHAIFYKADSSMPARYRPSLEIYWQVNPRSLHFVTNPEKKIVARIKTDVLLVSEDGHIKEDHFISQTNPRSTAAELTDLNILEIRRYELKPGLTKVVFKLTDVNDTNSVFVYRDSFTVSPEPRNPFYSDIQLLDTFFKSGLKTPFAKNERQHLPLCADFLDDNKRVLHYYVELNGLETVARTGYPLVRRVRISKKEDEGFMADMGVTDTILNPGSISAPASIPIGKLLSGNYFLVATLEGRAGEILASRSRFFQRLNLHPEKQIEKKIEAKEIFKDSAMEHVTVLDLDKTFLAKYNIAQIKSMLKMLLPISDQTQTNTINGFLKKPDEMYMRYFVYNYFQALDPKDPAAAWKEYSDKVREVNKKFTAQGTAGYETERGFLYLRYGPPTDVVTVTSETGSQPYEIWQYNVLTQFTNKKELANALFLFYKPDQLMSDFRLLHSTVTGEVINSSWRLYLYSSANSSSSGSSANSNSRAEQYFGNR